MSSLYSKTIVTVTSTQPAVSSTSLKSLKGSMTLPLQSANTASSSAPIRGLTPLAQLNSPDLRSLGLISGSGITPFLASPDFDKLISQSIGITPTSGAVNSAQTPNTFLNPKFVTAEQEQFVLKFDEKIQTMIKQEQRGPDENSSSSQQLMTISDSIVTVSSSQQPREQQMVELQVCTDDSMEGDQFSDSSLQHHQGSSDQEILKLQRKRQRNRDAARKCRERKLERIRFLEERVSELKSQNGRLQRNAADLREQVRTLQQVIVQHTRKGCSLKDSLTLTRLGLS